MVVATVFANVLFFLSNALNSSTPLSDALLDLRSSTPFASGILHWNLHFQSSVEIVLVLLAMVQVPIMLFAKPYFLYQRQKRQDRYSTLTEPSQVSMPIKTACLLRLLIFLKIIIKDTKKTESTQESNFEILNSRVSVPTLMEMTLKSSMPRSRPRSQLDTDTGMVTDHSRWETSWSTKPSTLSSSFSDAFRTLLLTFVYGLFLSLMLVSFSIL